MEKENCEYCFEKEKNCVCHWNKCAECGKQIPDSHASEYRGRVWCESEHNFDEQVAKRDYEREEVMAVTNASVKSQRNGEFINNRQKYNLGNVAGDGLPIIKVREPEILKKYESSNNKEICGSCKEEKYIKFECGFCSEGRMCKECGEEHRSWCQTRNDWKIL